MVDHFGVLLLKAAELNGDFQAIGNGPNLAGVVFESLLGTGDQRRNPATFCRLRSIR